MSAVRVIGVILFFLGLLAVVVGGFNGYGTLFSWNGRHPVDVIALGEGRVVEKLTPVPGRRYTVSVQVRFEREGLEHREGITVVEAKMPLAVRVKDPAGTTRAEVVGWLDPAEPPNVLYGHSVQEPRRLPRPAGSAATSRWGRSSQATPELAVERLVGPFAASSDAPLSIEVDLGPDRVGRARIAERRLVIYDDALPPKVWNAFLLAGGGGALLVAGLVLLVAGWFRRRGSRRKRGGIPAPNVV